MSADCKLLELPPVGETNHRTGHCYCHLCTCGEHICPGDGLKGDRYLKSALASIYKKDFTKKNSGRSEAYLRDCALNPGCNKMDLKTIKQQDFVKFDCEKTKSAKYERKNNTNVLKFAGSSNYRSEFPNWGHYEFIHIGKFRGPYRNSEVKFSPQTTYTQNFCQGLKGQGTKSAKKLFESNPITAEEMFFSNTTSRESYKTFGKKNFPEKAKNVALGILPLEAPKSAYETLYRTDFNWKDTPTTYPKKTPRY